MRKQKSPTPVSASTTHLEWELSTGRIVENVLKGDTRRLATRNIVDMSDDKIRNMFTSEEWAEIKKAAKPRPDPRQIPTLSDLDSLYTIGSSLIASCDDPFDFDVWLGLALVKAHRIYNESFMFMSHGERTYDVVWSTYIDDCLRGSGLYVSRGELQSTSIKALRNKGRTLDESIRSGPKFDGIVKSYHTDLEYGFLEASKDYAAGYDSKLIRDTLKAINAMRAALVNCSNLVRHEQDFRAHEVASIVTSAHTMRTLHMCYGGGMVMLLQRGEPVQLPKDYNPGALRQVLLEAAAVKDMWTRNKLKPELMDGWVDHQPTFRLPH